MSTIIIEPIFNEYPFLKFQIDNLCKVLKPDYFFLIDGMFPNGPENTFKDEDKINFIKKYTLNGKGKSSLDLKKVEKLVNKKKKQYTNTLFYLIRADYGDTTTKEAYYKAYTYFENFINIGENDIIFPLEADLFIHERDKEKLIKFMKKSRKNRGYCANFLRFFESPSILLTKKRLRKLFFKYGNGKIYYKAMKMNFGERYHRILRIKKINMSVYHYEWLRCGKYLDMRIDQLKPKRGPEFEREIKESIKFIKENYKELYKFNEQLRKYGLVYDGSFNKKMNHPETILNHPKFKLYLNP